MGRNAFFNFKTFTVNFTKTVFPVGTDSSLLGAWMCKHASTKDTKINVLDIGCGTGILSLFAAKTLDASVTAIDIQETAVEQCLENVILNQEQENISVHLSDIASYDGPSNFFDIVVSNPPYFPDIKDVKTEREIARQTGLHFDLNTLLQKASLLLNSSGKVFLVIPSDQTQQYIASALKNNLYLVQIAFVKGTHQSEIKRTLLCFSKAESNYVKSELIVLEKERNQYDLKALKLLKPYYLNL